MTPKFRNLLVILLLSSTSLSMAQVGIGTTTPEAGLDIETDGASGNAFRITDGTNTDVIVSQDGNVGVGTATPDASAILDIKATDKGMLVSRVSLTGTTDVTTIATPATSLLVYNTATVSDVTPGYYYWNGTAWTPLSSSGGLLVDADGDTKVEVGQTADEDNIRFSTAGTEQVTITEIGNVGIGFDTPITKLDVNGAIYGTSEVRAYRNRTLGGEKYTKMYLNGNDGGIEYVNNADPSRDLFIINKNANVGANIYFRTQNINRMVMTGAGNLGVGTINPTALLHVNGDMILNNKIESPDGEFLELQSNDPDYGVIIRQKATDGTEYGNIEVGDTYLGFGCHTDGSALVVTENDRVGIGTTAPEAPLHVFSNRQALIFNNPRFLATRSEVNGDPGIASASGNYAIGAWFDDAKNVSIYANGSIVGNTLVSGDNVSFSDERIKKQLGQSNSVEDLSTLMKIKIDNYSLIDSIKYGNKQVKKVIAQKLEKVLPNAVSLFTRYIPNVYRLAKEVSFNETSMELRLQMPILIEEKLSKGDKLQIDVLKENLTQSVEVLGKIKSVSGSEIVVIIDVSNEDGLDAARNAREAFVYGKEVDDFRVVDYDAISMLNVSATQEQQRLIENLQKENEALQKESEVLKAGNKKLNASLSGLTSEVAQIKAMLSTGVSNQSASASN